MCPCADICSCVVACVHSCQPDGRQFGAVLPRSGAPSYLQYVGPAGITVTRKAKAWQADAAMPPPPPPGSRTKRARAYRMSLGGEMAIAHELTTDELDLGDDQALAL